MALYRLLILISWSRKFELIYLIQIHNIFCLSVYLSDFQLILNQEGEIGTAGLASMETLDDSGGGTQDDGMESVKLDVDVSNLLLRKYILIFEKNVGKCH